MFLSRYLEKKVTLNYLTKNDIIRGSRPWLQTWLRGAALCHPCPLLTQHQLPLRPHLHQEKHSCFSSCHWENKLISEASWKLVPSPPTTSFLALTQAASSSFKQVLLSHRIVRVFPYIEENLWKPDESLWFGFSSVLLKTLPTEIGEAVQSSPPQQTAEV